MNHIIQLLHKQKEKFEKKFGVDIGECAMEKILQHQSNAQRQLIDVIIESTKMLRHELGQQSSEATDNLLESWKEGHTKALHEIITLLEEAKKNL